MQQAGRHNQREYHLAKLAGKSGTSCAQATPKVFIRDW